MSIIRKTMLGVVAGAALAAPMAAATTPAGAGSEARAPAAAVLVNPLPWPFAEPGADAAAAEAERLLGGWRAPAAQARVGVDVTVYVKAFYLRGTDQGKITHSQALSQVRWLDHSYNGGQGGAATRFDFVFGGYKNIPIDNRRVRIAQTRAGDGSTYPRRTRRLMAAHHDGGARTLNLYVADLPGQTLGVSTFPQYAKRHTDVDGIWLERSAFRGTPEGNGFTRQGDTAVHEAGHWIGALRHVQLRRKCSHNFMSYSSDRCMTSFTTPQAGQLSDMWSRFRD